MGRQFSSSCLVLVALAAMFYGSQARVLTHLLRGRGGDICRKADYPGLCRNTVKGLLNPSVAIEKAIRQLISETKRAKGKIQGRSQVLGVCREMYDDAASNLQTSLSNLKKHDKPSLNINLSAAMTDFGTCDDAVNEGGPGSAITRTNAILTHLTSNCLYLSSLIR